MTKLSAGILLYDFKLAGKLCVFLVHPGGPFWKNKDEGAWSIPKGEYTEGEDALSAAKREFKEETGNELPNGNLHLLQPVRLTSGKIISAWAMQATVDPTIIKSNEFEMEWPPRSGKKQLFPEVDRAAWFEIEETKIKINKRQAPLLEQLIAIVS